MFKDLLNEARQRLSEIAKDPNRYSKLLEGLVLQVTHPVWPCGNGLFVLFVFKAKISFINLFKGFYQLLEPKVTVRCRQQDVDMVQVGLNWLNVRNTGFSMHDKLGFDAFFFLTRQTAVNKNIPIYQEAVKMKITVKLDQDRFLPSGM